jgi:hypothetical protein
MFLEWTVGDMEWIGVRGGASLIYRKLTIDSL